MNWKAFIATLILVPLLDAIWLGMVASNFYTTRIGDLARLGDDGKMKPIFWTAGIVYVLYDFTNMSTLKHWPMELAFADMVWGSVVIAASSVAGYFLTVKFE